MACITISDFVGETSIKSFVGIHFKFLIYFAQYCYEYTKHFLSCGWCGFDCVNNNVITFLNTFITCILFKKVVKWMNKWITRLLWNTSRIFCACIQELFYLLYGDTTIPLIRFNRQQSNIVCSFKQRIEKQKWAATWFFVPKSCIILYRNMKFQTSK